MGAETGSDVVGLVQDDTLELCLEPTAKYPG